MSEEIPFNAWSRDMIEQGKKVCTSIVLEKLSDLVFDIDSFIKQQTKYNEGEA